MNINSPKSIKIYINSLITEEITDITTFIKRSVLTSLVILKTLKALKIRTDLNADKLPFPDPVANYTRLIQTTKASNKFIVSVKSSKP